jgi:serine/threonine protein kinase
VERTGGGSAPGTCPTGDGVLADLMSASLAELAQSGGVSPRITRDEWWIRVEPSTTLPQQGWKLHVSSAVPAAEAVLRAVLPILIPRGVRFKVVASLEKLTELNGNADTLSQAGKFVTVYPVDDAQAVDLATALDEATRGLRGPAIRSDHPLRPDSLLHYRYGGFSERYVQTPLGAILPAVSSPDGELVPDARRAVYDPPVWARDPFIAAGIVTEASPDRLLGGRYRVSKTLHDSPRGTVVAAVDVETGQACVLKSARRDALLGVDGRDARDRLRHEAAVLERLGPDPGIPCVRGLFEHHGDLFLALDYVPGRTLQLYIHDVARIGATVHNEQVAAWGLEIAGLVDKVHDNGMVYRDLKAQNVIVKPDSQLCLLDFELAHDGQSGYLPYGHGTPGYMSPQQAAGNPPAVGDDVYSLGALLYFAATGADPVSAPRPGNLLDRPVALLNPAMDPRLVRLITRCLDPDPACRFPSMNCLRAALLPTRDGLMRASFSDGTATITDGEDIARQRSKELARSIGDTLRHRSRLNPAGGGLVWTSDDRASGACCRNLDTGLAGVVLALAELTEDLGCPEDRAVLEESVELLVNTPRPAGPPLAGLFVGEGGVGAAILRAGLVLEESSLITRAKEYGRWIESQPYVSPDVFAGTAGRLRFHLWLWGATSEAQHLRAAVDSGNALLDAAEVGDDGGYRWTGPAQYGHLPGRVYLGYARGAAGVADTLLDLFEATADERYLAAARSTARWLAGLATPVVPGSLDVNWPTVQNGPFFGAFWCHGAAGVGTFFLHVARHGPEAAWGELAARAALAVSRGRWSGPGQCHGLAGSIEFLMDMWQETKDPSYLTEARSLERLLEPYVRGWDERSAPTKAPTSGYMFGLAGALVALLRLSDSSHPPRQLSALGFSRRSAAERWAR